MSTSYFHLLKKIAYCSLIIVGTVSSAARATAPEQEWNQICDAENKPVISPDQTYCRIVPQVSQRFVPGTSAVVAECATGGHIVEVPGDTEITQVTLQVPLSAPVTIPAFDKLPARVAHQWTFTLQIDRGYLCHRLTRMQVFEEFTRQESIEIVKALTRLDTYTTKKVGSMPPRTLDYLQLTFKNQLGRNLTETELRGVYVKSFRTASSL